jgi:enoyl-CoA hydratase/carnithine racemase
VELEMSNNHGQNELAVISETECFVTRITLNSPETGNVINRTNLDILRSILKSSIKSDACRLIIIQGRDGVFSKGMDFKGFVKDSGAKFSNDFSEPYKDILNLIHYSPKPVIAYIDGEVLAGGMGIALACDIVLATENSTFGLSEVLFGIIPAFVTPVLLTRIPLKKLYYLILSSKRIDAAEACQIGLVDDLLDSKRAPRLLKNYIKRILYSSPKALALTKEFSHEVLGKQFKDAVDLAQDKLTELLNDEQNARAVEAFMNGHKPDWAISYRGK